LDNDPDEADGESRYEGKGCQQNPISQSGAGVHDGFLPFFSYDRVDLCGKNKRREVRAKTLAHPL
jgi:hypothetical protein